MEDLRGESAVLDYARAQSSSQDRKAVRLRRWESNVLALNYIGVTFGVVFTYLASGATGYGVMGLMLVGYFLGAIMIALNVLPTIMCMGHHGISKATRRKLWVSMFSGIALVVGGIVILYGRPAQGC